MAEPTPNRHIEALRRAISDRQLVPVVGAGVSKQVADIPSWWGIIQNGLEYISEAGIATNEELKSAQELRDAGQLVPAAERVREMLGGPYGAFSSWLTNLFGKRRRDVSLERAAAINSIVNLMCPVIATTNYDRLISELHYDFFPDVTWQKPALMQRALRDGGKVLHLHGVYEEPDSVVFGQSDYDRIVKDKAYELVLGTLWTQKTLLFIGCSLNGLQDPDFQRLLTWATETFKGSPYTHYALALNGTSPEQVRAFLNDWHIQILGYGNDYGDLSGWLDAMNPRLMEAQAARDENNRLAMTVSTSVQITGAIPAHSQEAPDIPRYMQFVNETVQDAANIHPLMVEESTPSPTFDDWHFNMTVQSSGTSLVRYSLSDAVSKYPQLVLVGEPGSGKTQLLRQEASKTYAEFEQATALRAGEQPFQIPVLLSLSGYSAQPISDLVREAFQLAGVEISNEDVAHLATGGRLYLLLDDFDTVHPQHAPVLQRHIKDWKMRYQRSRVVISTRRASDAHSLELPVFTVSRLELAAVHEFLETSLGLSREDALAIQRGLPREFLDLQNSPLTLKLLAGVYLANERTIPKSRSKLYQMSTDVLLSRSEARGYTLVERSDKLRLLSLLARWMQDNHTYQITMSDLATLVQRWVTDLDNAFAVSHLRTMDMLQVRTELAQSELLRFAAGGALEFVHRTFIAYLAALEIRREELSTLIGVEDWQTSILFWVSMHPREVTDVLLPLVVDNPIRLGAIIRERASQRDTGTAAEPDVSVWFTDFVRYFNRFAEQFSALSDPRWGIPMPSLPLEALVTLPSHSGYRLVWRTVSYPPDRAVVWVDHPSLDELIRQLRQQFYLPVWLFPHWMLRRYHPVEAAFNWTLRSLHDRLLLTNWGRRPQEYPAGSEQPHPAIASLHESLSYYRAFAETLPHSVREELPLHASTGFDLVAEVREHSDPNKAGITYAFVPNGGVEVKVHQRISNQSRQSNTPRLLVEGSDGRWTANIDGEERTVLNVASALLDSVLGEQPTFQAQKWLRDDLEKTLPGFPPEVL